MRVLTLLFLVTFVSPALSWHTNTHLTMTRDAVALMPSEMQKMFIEHQKYVEAGIKDPDEILKDWSNHFYIPQGPKGGGLDRIEKLIKIVQTKLKNSNTVDTGKQLCYLAHYIGDLWTPETLINQSTMANKDFVQNHDILVVFEGYKEPITDYKDYFQKRVEWRWRLENSDVVQPMLYSEAVNDIARVWLSLWQQSGKALEPVKATVIDHKKGALNVNFERLLVEEYYFYESWDPSASWVDNYNNRTSEMSRLAQTIAGPSDEVLAEHASKRSQENLMKLGSKSPFVMVDSSLKVLGEKSYFVARIRNRGKEEIPNLSLMYPGVRGAIDQVQSLKPGQVVKLEGFLPVDAKREGVQLIFATNQ